MFYKQIILQRGLPFEVKIPSARPVDISTLKENLIASMKNITMEKIVSDYHSLPERDR